MSWGWLVAAAGAGCLLGAWACWRLMSDRSRRAEAVQSAVDRVEADADADLDELADARDRDRAELADAWEACDARDPVADDHQ